MHLTQCGSSGAMYAVSPSFNTKATSPSPPEATVNSKTPDFTPAAVSDQKIKKKNKNEGMTLELTRTKDILAYLGSVKPEGQFLCGFAMETENLLANAAEKLTKKNADMIVANSLRTKGAGFGTDTNVVTILKQGGSVELPILSKNEVADRILDQILTR